MRQFILLLLLFLSTCQRLPTDPSDPEIERSQFVVAPGYEVSLFAAEPMLANPVQMAWDTRGRLWVLCSPTYPQLEPGEEPADFLVILEDADEDGRADRHTVFADGLLVPTGFEFGDGGVYVANQPDLLFLADTNGDDRADVRKTLLSGFGTEDNHHAISAFTWGPGGNLYFQSGIFLHTQVETPHGLIRADDGAVFEFRPRELKLGLHVYGTGTNPWGHAFDRWGQNFLTEGPQGGIWYLTPGQVPFWAKQRVPGIKQPPKSCGVTFASGGHLPGDMQDVFVLNAFKNRAVHRYRLDDDSSGFSAQEIVPPLIVSKEEYFRPVDVKMGPDGAIYILDWYNPIIGHMQYNFRDPRRDHNHGRVWRITARGRPPLDGPDIEGSPILQLLDNLRSPELYTRQQSRRRLYELDPQAVASNLHEWVAKLDPSDPDYEEARLNALWTYQTVDRVAPVLLKDLLRSSDSRVRAASTRVLRYWRDRVPDALDELAVQIEDSHPRVRLEALVALSHIPSLRSMELALSVLNQAMDRYLEYALTLTVNALREIWEPAYAAGRFDFGGPDRLSFVVGTVPSQGAAGELLVQLMDGRVSLQDRSQVVQLIAQNGNPQVLADLVRFAEDNFDAPLLTESMEALTVAARERNVVPVRNLGFPRGQFAHRNEKLKAAAIRLAGAWGHEIHNTFRNYLSLGSPRIDAAVVDGLVFLGDEKSREVLIEISETSSRDLQVRATGALASLDLPQASRRAAALLAATDTVEPARLLAAFLGREGGARSLALALAHVDLNPDSSKLALRYLNSVGTRVPELRQVFSDSAGLSSEPLELSPVEVARLVRQVENSGDAGRGEELFRSPELNCLQCHAIGGGGGHLGPDLSGLGTGSPLDYIVESVLFPNQQIREGYEAWEVSTRDGDFQSGILVRDTGDEMVLRDAVHEEIAVPLEKVVSRRPTGSLMPDGLTIPLTRAELVDLLRFVSEAGTPGPFSVPDRPIVRTWRVLESLPADLTALVQKHEVLPAGVEELEWTPRYSLVSGLLPVTAFRSRSRLPVLARCRLEVTTPGLVGLRVNSTTGLQLWIDRQPVSLQARPVFELDQGEHHFTLAIDPSRVGEGIQVEFVRVPASPSRFQVINGR